jgi:hypothetical protein
MSQRIGVLKLCLLPSEIELGTTLSANLRVFF